MKRGKRGHSYHNTTGSIGGDLARYEDAAASQEGAVLAFWRQHPDIEYTPEDIGAIVLPGTPRTSWGRALTNLTQAGYLEKTTRQKIGQWGRPIYYWRLRKERRTELGEQPSLFQ